MTTETLFYILAGINIVILGWLVFLTAKYKKVYDKAKMLFETEKEGNISKVIKDYLKDVKSVEDHCFDLDNETKKIEKMAKSSLQRVGYVRYNPFGDVGSDQSFSLCMLDKSGNGFVLSSIHSRDGSRVYFKPVQRGESTYNLSKEEEKAIESAKKK